MKKLQILLILAWAMLIVITARAFSEMGALQATGVFYSDILRAGWRGQLNFDFQIYLILAALWVLYREKISFKGCIFAILALAAGSIFLAPYLAYLIYSTKGDIKQILLGGNNDVR